MFDCEKEFLNSLVKDGVVITGTDTGVGKTLFSIHCLLHTQGTYWKPIQSGQPCDRERVQKATGLDDSHFIQEQYLLTQPLSPHEAARHDGKHISLDHVFIPQNIGHLPLIVEGAGGVLVPLNEKELMIDLFIRLQLPIIVVARSTLGTINHTLLTLQCLQQRGLSVLGVVMVGPHRPATENAIFSYGQIPVITRSLTLFSPRFVTDEVG